MEIFRNQKKFRHRSIRSKMQIGKRQKAIEAAKKRVENMRPLTEEEVREKLQRIRDIHLMVWLMESESGKIPDRERISNFNQAQHQLERHRIMISLPGDKASTGINDESKFRRITHVVSVSGNTTDFESVPN